MNQTNKKGSRKPERKANAGSVTMLMEFPHSPDVEPLGEQDAKLYEVGSWHIDAHKTQDL